MSASNRRGRAVKYLRHLPNVVVKSVSRLCALNASTLSDHDAVSPDIESSFGVKAEILGYKVADIDHTLWDMFAKVIKNYPDREALVSMWQPAKTAAKLTEYNDIQDSPAHADNLEPTRLTFSDLDKASGALSRWLYGLAANTDGAATLRGRRLVVYAWNSLEWAVVLWTAARLGMVFVPLDPRSIVDAQATLSFLSPAVVVAQDAETAQSLEASGWIDDMALKVQCRGVRVDGWQRIIDWANAITDDAVTERLEENERPDPSDQALIIFTSGTTSKPKACPYTHRNVWSATNDYDAHKNTELIDRWLVHTPVAHIFAINNALRAWRVGSVVVFPSRSFEVGATIRALVKERCNIMSAVPTLVKTIVAHPDFPGKDKLSIDIVSISATMIRQEDLEQCRRDLGARHVIQAYGMSEGAPILSWSRRDPMLRDGRREGVGKVLPGANIRICRPGSRELVGRGDVGELHIGGTTVVAGYLQDGDDASSPEFYVDDVGNWLMTGDQARMDSDGVIHILGRYKDLIIRAGENISPARLETHLSEAGVSVSVQSIVAASASPNFFLLTISQAQVVGIPDEIAGQVPVAVVVSVPKGVSKADIFAKALGLGPGFGLADVLLMKEDLGLDALPTTTLGKVKKAELRDVVAGYLGLHTNASTPARKGEEERESKAKRLVRDAEPAHVADLETQLLEIWHKCVGIRPAPTDLISTFADSITILRVCDRVTTEIGCRLLFSDVIEHPTVAGQARLLTSRLETEKRSDLKSPWSRYVADTPSRSIVPRSTTESERQTSSCLSSSTTAHGIDVQSVVFALGGSVTDIEDVLPLRSGLLRVAFGSRPQTYHCRMVFRVSRPLAAVRAALAQVLSTRPLMRSLLAVSNRDGDDLPREAYHIALRQSPWLLQHLITETLVEDWNSAIKSVKDDSASVHSTVFMFQAELISIEDTPGTTIISLTYNHSVMDAITLFHLHTDLDRLIHATAEESSFRIASLMPFKNWTDLWWVNQNNEVARESVDFHVRRLRGITTRQDSLWPPQQAPGWMIGTDRDSSLAAERAVVRDRVWEGRWNNVQHNFVHARTSSVVHLEELQVLRRDYVIEPPVLAKSALAIFNAVRTGSTHAVFNTWESGRTWPFVPAWMEKTLPPAMGIDGPTVEWLVNMIEVDRSMTTGDFLRGMTDYDTLLSTHAHAPWNQILQGLGDEAAVALDASYRQGFVWDMSLGISRNGLGRMETIARYDWPDCGVFWNAFMIDKQTMQVLLSWDTAQLNEHEADGHCEFFASILRRLSQARNLHKSLDEVFFERP